jgi:hypothetical protein
MESYIQDKKRKLDKLTQESKQASPSKFASSPKKMAQSFPPVTCRILSLLPDIKAGELQSRYVQGEPSRFDNDFCVAPTDSLYLIF